MTAEMEELATMEVAIGAERWRLEELAELVAAARALVRGVSLERVDGRELAVPATDAVWLLMEAVDGPYRRREPADPALAGWRG